jgi:hypothetical protein
MRHLLSVEDLRPDDITTILDTAEGLKDIALRPIKKVPTLRGRTVCNLFFEDSTRTRISFELAAKRLSADVINFSAKGSSVSKGESLKDTALTLQAMGVDAIITDYPDRLRTVMAEKSLPLPPRARHSFQSTETSARPNAEIEKLPGGTAGLKFAAPVRGSPRARASRTITSSPAYFAIVVAFCTIELPRTPRMLTYAITPIAIAAT